MSMPRLLSVFALAACTTLSAAPTLAQTFPIPGKPVRIVVPFPPGGAADIQARAIGQKMSEWLGVSVIVDNKPGAGSLIGTQDVIKSTPDGHTLLYTITAVTQIPHLHKPAPYDLFKDLTPITMGVKASVVLTVNTATPANNAKELVAYMKANPGKLNYGSFGAGTLSHLAGEIMKRDMGVDIVHVPYKGAAEVTKGLLGGEVHMVFDGPTSAIANAASGRVKLIAAAGEKRVAALPDLPTLKEQGFPMAVDGWISFFGPAGMSPALVNTVYQHLARAIALPEIQKLMANAGNEPGGMPPAEFSALVRYHYDYWGKVIRELNIKVN